MSRGDLTSTCSVAGGVTRCRLRTVRWFRRRRGSLAACAGPAGAAAADGLGRRGDPRDRHPANRDALHPRRGQLEQVRDLGGRHERAPRGDQRSERPWEAAAVQTLADGHPAAVEAVLPASGLDGGGDRLARLGSVGGDDGLEPEEASVLGALGGAHLGAVERRGQPSLPKAPVFLAHELVLVPAVQAPGERFEPHRGRGQLEADDGGRRDRDLGARDLLERRGRLLLAVGDQRVHEAALLSESHHVAGFAQHAGARQGLLAVDAAESDVGVGGADRSVERGRRLRLAADVDRPLHLERPAVGGRDAADQLERDVWLPVADALGGPGADDVGDRLDHVLEVLALGLVVGREVKLVERVLAAAAAPHTARDEHEHQRADQQHAGGARDSDSLEQRERSVARRRRDSPYPRDGGGPGGAVARGGVPRGPSSGGRLRRACRSQRLERERMQRPDRAGQRAPRRRRARRRPAASRQDCPGGSHTFT